MTTVSKMTGKTLEVRSNKRKSREERETIEERKASDGREEIEDIGHQGHQSSVMSLSELTKTSVDMRMLRLRPIIIDVLNYCAGCPGLHLSCYSHLEQQF